jgi:hypothetical protein
MLSSGCKHTHFLWDRHQIYFQCKFYNRQEGSNTPNCHFLLVCKSHCQNCIHDCRLLGQDYYLVDHFWNYKIKFHNVSGTCDCLYGDDDGIAWLMVIVIRKMAMYWLYFIMAKKVVILQIGIFCWSVSHIVRIAVTIVVC